MSDSIHHNGVIERIENNTIYVKIIQQSACSGCHAQGICSAADKKEKIIEIPYDGGNYRPNEQVEIRGSTSQGLQAVLLAFVLPLILIVSAIAIGTRLQWDETSSGLIGLLLLIPYFCILYLLHNKLKKRFVFTIKKLI